MTLLFGIAQRRILTRTALRFAILLASGLITAG